jgi:N-acetylglucosamine kinase-like BadF-type ATPase
VPQIQYSFRVRYILGFDGGGTKTECVLVSLAGHVVARSVGGPSNSSRIGVEAAVDNVVATSDAALREARCTRSDVESIGAGLAGTTDAKRREQVRAGLLAAFPGARLMIMTDLEAALAAAPDGPAIVLVAGTGSAAIGRNGQTDLARAGGYGRFSSDEGSAFDVGRKAIACAMAERGKYQAESQIGSEILRHLGCADWAQVQERAHTAPDGVYPAIFPVISAAADAGDELARTVLRDAAENLGMLAGEAWTQLGLSGTAFTLVTMGGMLGRSHFFDAQLAGVLLKNLPDAREGKLRMSPAEAAALAAREAHGRA